jgi:hypothetical protein
MRWAISTDEIRRRQARVRDALARRDLTGPGVAGFRHSDTVLVTDSGAEALTYYPRALEDLTIPA